MLDEEQNDRDRQAAEETADASLVAIEALNKETLLKIDILRAEGVTAESAKQIVACYEKVTRTVEKYNLDRRCVYDFVSYLYDQKDYKYAAQLGERLLSDCGVSRNDDGAFFASVQNLVGIIYADQHI
ncbi:hypothetical protein [Gordonibacter sp.]|uniref:hypothetical protein n=1 Tax=Gordonibacter sp. TaxID=1968902 RepID=UPI001F94026F|nr:hypothetical protein [Gordonibacter sp.]HIW75906.1 hypothetical protein [Candidatus Gordonibacter avicola]